MIYFGMIFSIITAVYLFILFLNNNLYEEETINCMICKEDQNHNLNYNGRRRRID